MGNRIKHYLKKKRLRIITFSSIAKLGPDTLITMLNLVSIRQAAEAKIKYRHTNKQTTIPTNGLIDEEKPWKEVIAVPPE